MTTSSMSASRTKMLRRVSCAACAFSIFAIGVKPLLAQTLQSRPAVVGDTSPNPALSLPTGSKLMVRLDQQLDSSSAILGQSWTGTLVNDIPIGNKVALKSGTPVDGLVVGVKRSGRMHDSGSLTLRMIRVNDASVATDTLTRDRDGHWKSNVTKIGGGTVLGAAIGGLAGGVTGAVVGGAVGATTGTVAAATTGKKEADIPTEAVLTFTIQ